MKNTILSIFGYLIMSVLMACGVKGDPQPPIEPPYIGRGIPTFSRATKNIRVKKRNNKRTEDDWQEGEDFIDEKE